MNSILLLQRTLSRSIQALEPSRAVVMALGGVRGAKKKAAGSSTNGRGSAGRRLVSSSHSGTPPGRANDEDVCLFPRLMQHILFSKGIKVWPNKFAGTLLDLFCR